MAPLGPSASRDHTPVSRGIHLPDQDTAKAVACHSDSAFSLTLNTCAREFNVCKANVYHKLPIQMSSIINYRNWPKGNIHLGFILLKRPSVEEHNHHVVI